MKLLNCYIYNFGKYHEYKVDLNDNIHEIFLLNGEGKTTLVSFIVAVFFGGEVENVGNILKKYESIDHPHDVYGGEINFIYNNEEYNLIHTFSKKGNKDKFKSDILKLTKKGSSFVEKRFDDDSPITYFFKDIEKPTSAILNTVILSHETFTKNETEESLNDLFSSQLGELYDLKEFDNVVKALDEKIKQYGKVNVKNTLIAKVNNEFDEVAEQLKAKEKEIEKKKSELKSLYGVDNLRSIGGYVAGIDEDITNIEKEIEKLKADSSRIDVYKDYAHIEDLLKEKEKELAALSKTINNQSISDAIITTLDNLNEEIKNDRNKLDTLKQEFNVIKVDKDYLKISKEEVENIKKTYAQYESHKPELNSSVSSSNKTSKKSVTNIFMFLTAFFLVIAIVGLCLMGYLDEYASYMYVLLGVGGAGSIVSLVCLFISYNLKNKAQVANYTNTLKNAENKEILEKKRVLEAFFKKIRLSATDLKYSYDTFLKNYDSYVSLENRSEELQKEIDLLTASLKQKESKLVNELSKFGYNLKESIDAFLFHLRSTYKNIIEKNDEIKTIKNKLNDSKYKGFDKLDKNHLSYQSNQNLISDFNKKKIDLLDKRREVLEKLNDYNKAKEEREILNNECYELDAIMRNYGDLADRYKKGKRLLVEAKESIYATTYDPFIKELNKILDTQKTNEKFFNSYEIKTDEKSSSLVFKNKGVEKTASSLSQGYQDYLKLAVRFSFLNMIYKKEKPFIILDDPLVNMDKDRLSSIKEIIKTLSKDYQILYFFCHESRKIK